MQLVSELRDQTQIYHQQIEQNKLFKKIVNGTITKEEYQLLLQKLYGFWQPLELNLRKLPALNFYFQGRAKLPLLQQDLVALGLTKLNIENLPYCPHLPTMEDAIAYFGCLYVLEGSTMGGQIIVKLLKDHLSITPSTGCAYFYGYGKKTHLMWQQFCQLLNTITDAPDKQKVINTGIDTFIKLDQWISAS